MKNVYKGLIFAGVIGTMMAMSATNTYAKDAEGNTVIVIDPGHGGEDSGAQAVTGAFESDCNYEIAKAMQAELVKYDNVKVYLTREKDGWMSNTGRAMIAAELNADFLISVHNNSGSESSTGSLAYRSLNQYYSESTNDMCTLILDNLSTLGLYNGGVQTRESTDYATEDYYTLIGEGVRAGVPSIIVEHLFLSNAADASLVSNSDGSLITSFLDQMGVQDAKAVITYFNLTENKAVADNNTTVTLEKGYSLIATSPDGSTGDWYSSDTGVATVESDGTVTAVNGGTANIVLKKTDGTESNLIVNVNEPTEIALVGGLNPTFYETDEEFKALVKDDIFAKIIYSDGSVSQVKPESIGNIDYSKVGIQDIDITYGNLKGTLRICHNTESYVPVVTLPEETTAIETTAETSSEDITTVTEESSDKNSGNKTSFKKFIREFGIYILVVLVVLFIGVVIAILEKKARINKKRKNKGRKVL